MKIKILLVVMSVVVLAANSFGFEAAQGNIWTGANLSFSSRGIKYKDFDVDVDRVNLLVLDPSVRFFVANSFFIGPKFQWMGMFTGSNSVNLLKAGGEIGLAFNTSTVLPYFAVSPCAQIVEEESHFELPFEIK
ncbi:MAG: hypothetical protein Q4F84_02395 [Fibrobacter sp.]|nr:hypothetical protein [Fibrobacter sp.]